MVNLNRFCGIITVAMTKYPGKTNKQKILGKTFLRHIIPGYHLLLRGIQGRNFKQSIMRKKQQQKKNLQKRHLVPFVLASCGSA